VKHNNRHSEASFVVVILLLLLLVTLMPALARSASTTVLITAVYYDTYHTNEPDEAFRLMNISGATVDLAAWTVTDGPSEGAITLGGTLADGASVWIAREAASFALEFGFSPDYEYGADSDPAVPNLSLSGNLALANTGDELVLKDGGGTVVDYDHALALDPQYAAAYNNRGVARKAQGDLAAAIADYDQALALDPQYAAAYYNMARAYAQMTDAGEACAWLKKAIEADCEYREMALNDADFDNIREDGCFKMLMPEHMK
jgi:hypothetical protein